MRNGRIRALAARRHPAGARGDPDRFRGRLNAVDAELGRLRRTLSRSGPSGRSVIAEWILDNAYLISDAKTQVRSDLPPRFYRQLPLSPGEAREPRISRVARAAVESGDGFVELGAARSLLDAVQDVDELDSGEIWAFPTFLRLAVLEELVAAGRLASDPDRTSTSAEASRLQDRVAATVNTLRTFATLDWAEFFESVSRAEAVLRLQDPAGLYGQMDFDTRDRYRKVVENLSRWSGRTESDVARLAVERARLGGDALHVGFLLEDGGTELEADLGARVPTAVALGRRVDRWRGTLYFVGVAIGTLLTLAAIVAPLLLGGASAWGLAGALLIGLVPAHSLAVSLANWVATQLVDPRPLPKLAPDHALSAERQTVVAIPAMLSDAGDIGHLVRQMELNYEGNDEPHLRFVLLTDHLDAPNGSMPDDAALLEAAVASLEDLNRRRMALGQRAPFYLLHRERSWNEREGVWMGWERKRGKLEELNRFLTGSAQTGLSCFVGDPDDLKATAFVITLDADTVLPQGAAARLVGTLAHPLNRPVFDERGRVVRGYTILQPRVETLPGLELPTRFARVFEADRGLDLYAHAVSDVYQDLFDEGIFAGKGIYDLRAFQRSLEGRVPENAILSHDLFEGLHGRAGLVSDIAVFEDYPSDFITYAKRMHRWVRGDWQLVPWILPRIRSGGGWVRNRIDALGRWKLLDNLRRSLLLPSLLAMLLMGWTLDPARSWWWTLVAVTIPAVPALLGAVVAARRRARAPGQWAHAGGSPASIPAALSRWVAAVTFLPHQARVELDAILRTLIRVCFTRRKLLEWTTASTTAQLVRGRGRIFYWIEMAVAPGTALVVGAAILLVTPSVIGWALPLLAAWLVAPEVAYQISRPVRIGGRSLDDADRYEIRALARRTWAFYERVLQAEDHWLPPDNYQEEPLGVIAHRTSPTNMGLMLTAALGAHDLGYLPFTHLTALLGNTLRTLDGLERHRGHFLNWYDTRTLHPLAPLYVSTVDSGNLLGCLLTVSSGLREVAAEPVRGRSARGIEDTLHVLTEVLEGLDASGSTALSQARRDVRELARTIGQSPSLVELRGHVLAASERLVDIGDRVATLAETAALTVDPRQIADLLLWLRLSRQHLERTSQELERVAPWLDLPLGPTPLDGFAPASSRARAVFEGLRASDPSWQQIPRLVGELGPVLSDLDRELDEAGTPGDGPERRWIAEVADRLYASGRFVRESLGEAERIAARAEVLVTETDFTFLYNRERRLFHIGFNLSSGALDSSYYDLLASEARLASYLAIALGQVPAHHWLHLGRPFGRTRGGAVLMSWAGTMFEYLMPSLLMRSPDRSLVGMSCRTAINEQVRYGSERKVPWGISESAFYQTDAHGIYQYRAFGVPSLGLRAAVRDRLVVAPYASVLGLRFAPGRVMENLERLQALGMVGPLGFYEALDFGPVIREADGNPRVVRTWMAHHQGMILLALVNAELDDIMVRRFHQPAATSAAEFLLYEHVPARIRLEDRRNDDDLQEAPSQARSRSAAPWEANPMGLPTQLHALSNGTLSALVGADGSGGLSWGSMAITRWRADPIPGRWGSWIYVRDVDSGATWSVTPQPVPSPESEMDTRFLPHQVEFRRVHEGVAIRLRVGVSPTSDAEIRVLTVTNLSSRPRRLTLTSYAEVVLGDAGQDRRHPAFSKLFVETAGLPDGATVLHTRRTDDPHRQVTVGHTVVLEGPGLRIKGGWGDRHDLLGRGGSPAEPRGLGQPPRPVADLGIGVTDPIQSLAVDLELAAEGERDLAFVTGVASSKEGVMKTLTQLGSLARVGVALDQARGRARVQMESLGLAPEDAGSIQRLLSAVMLPSSRPPSDASPVVGGRDELWSLGVSGDLPILLVRVERHDETPPLMQLLRAHAYWSHQRIRIDLVVLDSDVDGYAQPLRSWLVGALTHLGRGETLNQPGGVHHVPLGRLSASALQALEAMSAVVLDTRNGSVAQQIEKLRRRYPSLPPFVPIPGPGTVHGRTEPLPAEPPLEHDNGFGGFADDGESYLIRVQDGRLPPAPWINVLATPDFGSIVSETGSGCTWVGNSAESRLTTWTNDPILDRPGEALYLRDEETGRIWSPTPGPAPSGQPYRTYHRAGETVFEHRAFGLDQRVSIAVTAASRCKVTRLTLTNLWDRPRRVTATYYAEWVLGNDREDHAGHLYTAIDPDHGLLTVRNQFVEPPDAAVGYLASTAPIHSATCDRVEFLGRGGLARPDGLSRIGLSRAHGGGRDPCAALQVHVDLPAGEATSVVFVLGAAASEAEAAETVSRLRSENTAPKVAHEVKEEWSRRLSRIEIRTPDRRLDVIVNRWLVYQALSSRLWGRTGLYQSSGAIGFRDQLQDSLAFLFLDAPTTRAQILTAAAHQFEEGDVLHWWHEGFRGVRTRCSDDLLWLPYATSLYLDATADTGVLDEAVPFLTGHPLADGELERYATWHPAESSASLYEHCLRAIERGLTSGPHGLPLIGTGDWNDSFDQLGPEGRGESVWLAWFLYDVVHRFGAWCDARGDRDLAARLRAAAEKACRAAEDHAWDGDWYRRATHDEGGWIGSRGNEEGEIDSLTQSWAVLSRGADPVRAGRAMTAVLEHLVDDERELVPLLTPPFRFAEPSPGYVRNYPPGVRENGGQYTHAGVWVAWALADLGRPDDAWRVVRYLNPVEKTSSAGAAARYRREPYAVCGDVYTSPSLAGIGGWSWYTGSAAWLYRLIVERIVGLRPVPGGLRVEPMPPGHWRTFEAIVRPDPQGERSDTRYHIRFERCETVPAGEVRVRVDGELQSAPMIPLRTDGQLHEVTVTLNPGHPGDWHENRLRTEDRPRADTPIPRSPP